jgi:RNA polymerase sigma-70 factor (ECF subfamily)
MGIDSSSPLPEYVSTLIKVTAARITGKYQRWESDLPDIEQAITLEVVRRRAKFDPRRANELAFYTCLVKHAAADIIAARKASNRDYRRERGSLNQWVRDDLGEWVRRVDTMTEGSARRHLGVSRLSEEEACDLAIDVHAAIAELPESLQTMCRHLMDCATVQDAARAAGVHRCTVYEAIHRIRAAFVQAGLEQYLPPDSGNPTTRGTRR